MTSKVDLFPLKQEQRDDDDDDHYVDRNSPEPDARFGRKTPKMGFTFTKTTWFRTPTLSCLVKKTFKEKARRVVQKGIYKGRPPELHRWLQSVILPGCGTSAVTDW